MYQAIDSVQLSAEDQMLGLKVPGQAPQHFNVSRKACALNQGKLV